MHQGYPKVHTETLGKVRIIVNCLIMLQPPVKCTSCTKIIEETASSEEDRASFPVSFATPSTQSQLTSPIHDSNGA
jgi:hypothetical protein